MEAAQKLDILTGTPHDLLDCHAQTWTKSWTELAEGVPQRADQQHNCFFLFLTNNTSNKPLISTKVLANFPLLSGKIHSHDWQKIDW